MGEHRVDLRKQMAYEAAQTTLWMAGPGVPSGATSNAFAMNIDIAPTIVRATGATAGLTMDGRALQDVLQEPDLGHDRFLPIYVPIVPGSPDPLPTGEGVRTWRFKYLRYADGSEELYDVRNDPFEELNHARDGWPWTSIKVAMRSLLAKAKSCSGDTCRESAPRSLQGQ
jgi:arylsulfatase A-like enzyme